MIFSIIYLAIVVVTIAGDWKMFEKAGKPGWAFLVPIYNVIVMLEIINKPIKWLLFLIIPILNIVYGIKYTSNWQKHSEKEQVLVSV